MKQVDPDLLEAFRFHYAHQGYVVGERARGALWHARQELKYRDNPRYRYRWEIEEHPDVSWCSEKDLELLNQETYFICVLFFERQCSKCDAWQVIDCLGGIHTDGSTETSRLFEAHMQERI